MKVLAIMRPAEGVDVRSALAVHGREELRALWRLYRDGAVCEMYSPGKPGAVLVLDAESLESATALLQTLPLIADSVTELELIELRPFAAIEMLFADEERG
jgi:hypothetical protein